MAGRAVFVIAIGSLVACPLTGCVGTGGKSARPTVTAHASSASHLPPIYPGTTVPPLPSSAETSTPSSTSTTRPVRILPGDGTYKMGADLSPGTYRSPGGESCYWERLRGLGGSIADVIANGAGTGPQVVHVAPSDVAFKTQHCFTWTLDPAATTTTSTTPVALPPGAQACPAVGEPAGSLTHSAVGSSSTSCPFAEQVRLAYVAGGAPGSTPRQVTAVSPVTGRLYDMTCAASGPLVTCSGGDGAVVYVY
jgi:hypothetical protein